MPAEFEYTKLRNPTSDLRLVQIACGEHEDELIFTITVERKHSLQQTKYNALSYTWGDVAVKTPIMLNRNIFFVTSNLEAALRSLRRSTLAEREVQLPLWIDAMSINQTDIDERDGQVRRMKDIYQNAEWVTIWFGNYHEPCDEDFIFNESRWGFGDPGRGTQVDTGAATQLALCLGYMLDDPAKEKTFPDGTKVCPAEVQDLRAWVQLSRLFRRPWFERLWVIQEISVSQRAMVFCGKYMILWSQLEAAAKYILNPTGISVPPHIQKILPLMAAHRVIHVSIKSMWNIDAKNILTVLHSTQEAKCLDPRDRLYAILGIVEDKEDIQIDYSIPVQEVYRNWAEKRIRRTNNLDILSACSDSSRLGDLPSWVPDLRRPFGQDKPLWIFSHIGGIQIIPHPSSAYYLIQKTMRECGNVKFSPDGLTLSIEGRPITTITDLSTLGDVISNLEDPTSPDIRLRQIINEWERGFLAKPTFDAKGYSEAVRAAVMRDYGVGDIRQQPWSAGILDFWRSGKVASQMEAQEFGRFLFPRIHGCQLFVTSDRNVGAVSGSCQAQVGDEIWMLRGGLSPFILRRVTLATCRLISPCFLYEAMWCICGLFPNHGARMVNLI